MVSKDVRVPKDDAALTLLFHLSARHLPSMLLGSEYPLIEIIPLVPASDYVPITDHKKFCNAIQRILLDVPSCCLKVTQSAMVCGPKKVNFLCKGDNDADNKMCHELLSVSITIITGIDPI